MTEIVGTCSKCGKDKSDSWSKSYCKSCSVEAVRKWRAANPDRVKEYEARKVKSAKYKVRVTSPEFLKKAADKAKALRASLSTEEKAKFDRRNHLREYRLTEDDYQSLLDQQNGRCAICLCWPDKRLAIDHNHKTGKVRGLLCSPCNGALGLFKEDCDLIEKAALYLEKYL